MSNIYFSEEPRGGTYDASIGIDVDLRIVGNDPVNGNLYDYDLLNRPAMSGSGSYLHSQEDNGFPEQANLYDTGKDGSKFARRARSRALDGLTQRRDQVQVQLADLTRIRDAGYWDSQSADEIQTGMLSEYDEETGIAGQVATGAALVAAGPGGILGAAAGGTYLYTEAEDTWIAERNNDIRIATEELNHLNQELQEATEAYDNDPMAVYKQALYSNQSEPFDKTLETVNNGRLVNIKKSSIDGLKNIDIVINKDNKDTSVKGILERNSISDNYFSDTNMNVLQDTIRYKVYEITDKVISKQSQNELYIVMRSIMLQFANFRVDVDDIKNEIKRLNEMVIKYAVDNISSNVIQHGGYIDDLSRLPTPLDRPSFSNTAKNYTYDISNLL